MYIAALIFREVHMYVHTILSLFTHARRTVRVCHYSCFNFLWLIHSLMKQGWVIEQESKWTLVETQQQRENSRLEHSPPPPHFLSLFISNIGAGQYLQPVFLSGQFMLQNAMLVQHQPVRATQRCNWNMTQQCVPCNEVRHPVMCT